MVVIPGPVEFLMGSPPGEGYADERPQRRTEVAPFRLGRYPVTQAEWTALMDENRSRFKGDLLPVENVSHALALEYCRWLSDQTGTTYRLPTEAEWEYACRAGSTTPFEVGPTISPSFQSTSWIFSPARTPVNTIGTSSSFFPESRIISLARSRIRTGSPMSST